MNMIIGNHDVDYASRVLALRLKLRRPREELVSQGIMPPLKTPPAFHEQRQRLERAKVGDCLQRKIRMRPDKSQLINQHILEDTSTDPLVSATHQRLKRARLERDLEGKIKNRPGPLELIEENILKTDNLVEQIIKDGSVAFMKTNSMDMLDEESQEICTDEPPSPSQSESSSVLFPDVRFANVPSPPDISTFFERLKNESGLNTPLLAASGLLSPGLDSGLTSPQQVTPPTPSLFSMPPTHTKTSSSSSSSTTSSKSRKKQAKRPKPKEIKFHEYKPPNDTNNKTLASATDDNPYNLLLMQQQLFLQLQLLQQQQAMQQQSGNPKEPTTSTSSLGSIASPGGNTDTVPAIPLKVGKITGNLEDMKVAELKIELKARGLHVSGTKPQLVERLRPYTEAYASRSNSTSSTYDISTSSPQGKVSSSTDIPLDVMSDISAPSSISSPPVSPPEIKQLPSVKSEPMSPGSVFMDPMSPQNLQSQIDSFTISSQNPLEDFKLHRSPSSGSMRSKTIPMDMDSNSNLEPCLADLTSEDPSQNDSSDLVKQQQRKIEELQQQLLLSQMQIQQQKQQLQSRPPPPPPPPLPPPSQAGNMRLQTTTSTPQSLIPGMIRTVPSQLSAGQIKVTNTTSGSPVGQPPSFQVSQSLAATTKAFSFGIPATAQQFTIPKHTMDLKSVSLPNGLFSSTKASSLPNSPTDTITDASSLSRSLTNPTFTIPPPKYEDAVRHSKIKNGNQAQAGGNARSTHTQDLDDLLEVLVDHGYQLPLTPRNRGHFTVSNSFPQTITLTQSPQRVHLSPPLTPPEARHPPLNAISRSMPPSHMTTELPMDIDAELSLGTIDLGVVKSERVSPDMKKEDQLANSLDITMIDGDSNILGLGTDSLTGTCASAADTHLDNWSLTGHCASSSDTNVDNWLDLVIPSSGSTLTPVSCTPPTGLSIENVLGNPLGKDPFSLNLFDLGEISTPTDLHHLEGDGWDNIPVGE
ncbi:uncharacterized protein [Antedon mediterranea]|uniref:uncharacterized protein isoform X4 n=1 Tax=Antedon mediterranea TaxID=105859 RepID=UPI003AF82326